VLTVQQEVDAPTDILKLRTALRAANAALETAQARSDKLEAELENVEEEPHTPPETLRLLRAQVITQRGVVRRLTTVRDAAQAAYHAAVLADPVHKPDPALPRVLLPVRVDTAYLPGTNGTDLAVRVYPDDIHVDPHEPELTAGELAAGKAYCHGR
jgi:hypothetical protein